MKSNTPEPTRFSTFFLAAVFTLLMIAAAFKETTQVHRPLPVSPTAPTAQSDLN